MSPTLLISIIGIPLLVLATYFLGFGKRRNIDEATLKPLLEAQGSTSELTEVLISGDGYSAIGELEDGRYFLIRSMGDDLASRIVSSAQIHLKRVQTKRPGIRIGVHDAGFPTVVIRCSEIETEKWARKLDAYTRIT